MEIRVDKTIYTLDALLKAAYSFVEVAYIHLAQDDRDWIVQWTDKEGCHTDPRALENELVTQQLRCRLVEQTADLRRLMLGRAYASTMLDNGVPDPDADAAAGGTTEAEDSVLRGWFDDHDSV